MKKIFFSIAIPIITLGVIALALNMAFGNVIEYITIEQLPNSNLTWYKYDTFGYLNGLKNAFRNIEQLSFTMPTRTWQDLSDGFWSGLGNNLAIILDYIIMIINILLYPLRIGFYMIQIVLQLIGINTLQGQYNDNPLKWLIDITYTFKSLQIPYI